MARETENLGARGGDSDRGPARVERDPGCRRRAGGRISEIQFFKKANTGESSLGVRCRPTQRTLDEIISTAGNGTEQTLRDQV